MPTKLPNFFQNKDKETAAAVKFSRGIVQTSATIHDLYRGFNNLSEVSFGLSTLLIGIFGKTYPETITQHEIDLHKLTNRSNDFHMVSMSEDQRVAIDWGQGCFMAINPTLFRNFTVDVHKTYHESMLVIPGRMEREAEHVALVVPYCSIKRITIRDKEVVNPFYLDIPSHHQEAIEAFQEIYSKLVTLLRNKYTLQPNDEAEKLALRDYVKSYLQFYDNYSDNNPFNKTPQELAIIHPEFMTYYFQFNPESFKIDCLKNIAIAATDDLFKNHHYTKLLDASSFNKSKDAMTYYEDPYSGPGYD